MKFLQKTIKFYHYLKINYIPMINKNTYIKILTIICLIIFTSCSNTENNQKIVENTGSNTSSWEILNTKEDCNAYYEKVIWKHKDNYDDCIGEGIDKSKWPECKRRLWLEKFWFDLEISIDKQSMKTTCWDYAIKAYQERFDSMVKILDEQFK